MGVVDAVSPSTEVETYAPTVAHPASTNTISEGVGVCKSNTDGYPHHQYDGETAANYVYDQRELTQKLRSTVLKAIL